MAPTVDYLPVATAGGANVDSQSNFAGSSYQTTGFASGLAQSKQCNKVWRQASMMASALANYIANKLNVNVLDDGNSATLLTNLSKAIAPIIFIQPAQVTVNANTGAVQVIVSFAFPAGFLNTVGKTIRLYCGGFGTQSVAANTANMFATINGVAVANPVTTMIGVGNFTFISRLNLTVLTTGATGTIQSLGDVMLFSGATAAGGIFDQLEVGTSGAVDLTAAVTLGIGIQFTSASASNNATSELFYLEALN